MSIEVQCYTVVVRRNALENLSPEAKRQFFATWRNDDIFREGAHLLATGLMNPKDHPPGPLAEIPFLKSKPQLREGENYIMFPDERIQGPVPGTDSSAEAP